MRSRCRIPNSATATQVLRRSSCSSIAQFPIVPFSWATKSESPIALLPSGRALVVGSGGEKDQQLAEALERAQQELEARTAQLEALQAELAAQQRRMELHAQTSAFVAWPEASLFLLIGLVSNT